jgi:hypothetical protein
MHKSQLNIYNVLNRLEGQNKRRYSDAEVAKASGLHRHTVRIMRNGKPEPTLDKLLNFFEAEGMPITIADLFTVSQD